MSPLDMGNPMVTLQLTSTQLSDPEVADAFRTLMASLQGFQGREEARVRAEIAKLQQDYGGDAAGGIGPFRRPFR